MREFHLRLRLRKEVTAVLPAVERAPHHTAQQRVIAETTTCPPHAAKEAPLPASAAINQDESIAVGSRCHGSVVIFLRHGHNTNRATPRTEHAPLEPDPQALGQLCCERSNVSTPRPTEPNHKYHELCLRASLETSPLVSFHNLVSVPFAISPSERCRTMKNAATTQARRRPPSAA